MQHLFNKKRLPQVQEFLKDLSGEWSELTAKQITSKYFNNSRSFSHNAIKILEENNIIEIERSDKSYIDGKWVMNSNRYRLSNANEPKIITEKVFFNEEPARIIKFKYKGIYEVCETFTQEDKEIIKKIKNELSQVMDESLFISSCQECGMSKEKSWFFYNKISNEIFNQ
jgi:hypothetical protein